MWKIFNVSVTHEKVLVKKYRFCLKLIEKKYFKRRRRMKYWYWIILEFWGQQYFTLPLVQNP